ncbi:MAG: biotin--[acetyl-CoA-carboxylase] ligase [Actinomycetaceae bacterium]|nr:biotin--[acetyl-CoA-carboxylase] ligase [Actinomycetaceae bacterium]
MWVLPAQRECRPTARKDGEMSALDQAGQSEANLPPARFPLTGAQAAVLFHTELTGSTQDDLTALWEAGRIPDFTVMVADDQTAGRGRSGRRWFSAAGRSLLVSVLVEVPESVEEHVALLTLIGAAAARSAINTCTDRDAALLSWPNDVVVRVPEPRKVAGVLGEFCGRRDGKIACVIGLGANLSLEADELPTPTSASLATAGLPVPTRDEVAAAWLQGLRERIDALVEAGDPVASGLIDEVNACCETLRPGITVGRPRATPLTGTGREILADGSLDMVTDDGPVVVTSGEVSLLGRMERAAGPEQHTPPIGHHVSRHHKAIQWSQSSRGKES